MNTKSNKPTKTKSKMKKTMRFLSMAALALVGAVMTGCSSDDNYIEQQPENKSKVVTLTTTVGLDGGATTRALTSSGVKTFAAGETMALVYKKTGGTTAVAVSDALKGDGDIASGAKSATFTFTLEDPDNSKNVTYVYPAAMAKADGSINYDALDAQDGTLATLSSSLDLATYTDSWNGTALPSATLANQLAILALTLKDYDGANNITSTITGMTLSDGTNSYTITPSSLSTIYVAIKPTTSASIDVTATSGNIDYVKSLTSKTYEASNGYPISWKMDPKDAIKGKFSVSNTKQVYFSKGNLQATWNGSTWSWAFATNQWDYIGNAAGNTSINGDGTVSANNVTVDLFGWVGASSTWTGAAQYGISNSTTTKSTSTYGNVVEEALKSDWGNTIGTGWRTLTNNEWTYLFNTRTSGSTVNSTSNARYTHATINTDGTGVNGMILFPDGVTIANGEATWGKINGNSPWGTKCTSAQWTALAAKGCVFLPAAGYRTGSSVSNAGTHGRYWSTVPYTVDASTTASTKAYRVYFISNSLYPASNDNRNVGHSVRLVRQVE